MKVIFLVSIVQFISIMNVYTQSLKTKYNNLGGDYLILSNEYAEFRFGSIFGGGSIVFRNGQTNFEINNDFSYTGRTESFILESATNQSVNSGVLRFQLWTENYTPLPSSEFVIYARKNKRATIFAESLKADGIAELHLQRLPIDSMIYIEANNLYPLKIRLDDITSKTYTIVLVESKGSLLYSKDEYTKIVCECINNDTLRCLISQRWHKKKMKQFESILFKESD
jgi:hypothetical protein